MPSLSAHFSDSEIPTIMAAVKASGDRKPGTYLAVAVRQRLERDGFMVGTPSVDVGAVAQATAEIVGQERVLQVLESAKKEALAAKAANIG